MMCITALFLKLRQCEERSDAAIQCDDCGGRMYYTANAVTGLLRLWLAMTISWAGLRGNLRGHEMEMTVSCGAGIAESCKPGIGT